MKIIGVIPARYASSRFPGKPLADICGKPMLWWVYQQARNVPEFDGIYVATDDNRVSRLCTQYEIPFVMTGEHSTHIARVHEVSTMIDADYYVNVNGDEPLIEPKTIRAVIPHAPSDLPKVFGLMKVLRDPVELIDPTNIKVATNKEGIALYISRAPIPYPYKTIMFEYKKAIGVECWNKAALELFVHSEPGQMEIIEDLVALRFFENGCPMHYTLVESNSLSVDTPKDLEKVRSIMKNLLKKEDSLNGSDDSAS